MEHFEMDTRIRTGGGAYTSGLAGLLLLLLGLLALSPGTAPAEPASGDSVALLLRNNVVRITVEMETGAIRNGFGFIAGQRGDDLFLATANHVVRSGLPGDLTREISIRFFGDPGRSHQGELMETYYPSPQDLAVVRVRKPDGLVWEPRATVPPDSLRSGVRGTSVWFVGRGGDWYVPTVPGRVNSDRPDLNSILFVDINSVMPGTSGAPLISASGIMGMIVQDEAGGVARAVSIEAIRQAFAEWRYPWSLEATAAGEPETVAAVAPEPKPKPEPKPMPEPEPPSDTAVTLVPPPKAAPLDSKGGIAIFPLLLQQDANRFGHIFKRIITEAVTESGFYDRILECFQDTRHRGSNGEIRFDSALREQIWVKEGWFSGVKPDATLIRRLGRELGVETVLLFAARVSTGRDAMRFYLVDVASGKVWEKKGFTDWQVSDFQDTVVEASFDTKAIAGAVLEEYQAAVNR
jgi:hypothetical protein